jgi:hypothetical protein
MQSLRDAVDKQRDDAERAEVVADKLLPFRPRPLRIGLTAERLSSDVPVSSANSASMSRVDSPRGRFDRHRL